MWAPSPRRTNSGSPPTLRNARTGELTPPGMRCAARSNSARLRAPVELDDVTSLLGARASSATPTTIHLSHVREALRHDGCLERRQGADAVDHTPADVVVGRVRVAGADAQGVADLHRRRCRH